MTLRRTALVAFLVLSACTTTTPAASPAASTVDPATSTSVDPTTTTVAASPATTTVTATAVDPTTTALGGSTGIVPDSSAAVAGTVPADNLNPAVTQATIKSTICVPGFTKPIRPPVSFTDRLKVHQIASYGYADHSPGSYEEDHVVALGLGGAPSALVNLWPEPHSVSGVDDQLENDLHAKVCSGTLTLAAAQAQIYAAKAAHGYDRAKSAA